MTGLINAGSPFVENPTEVAEQNFVPALDPNNVLLGVFWLPMPPVTSLGFLNVSITSVPKVLPRRYFQHSTSEIAVAVVTVSDIELVRGDNNFFEARRFEWMFDKGPAHVFGSLGQFLSPNTKRSLIESILRGNTMAIYFVPTSLPPSNSDSFQDSLTVDNIFANPFVDPTLTDIYGQSVDTPLSGFVGEPSPDFVFNQYPEAMTWVIEHPLDANPLVAIYTAGGVNLTALASARYSNGRITIEFPQAIAGTAFLITAKNKRLN